MMQEDVPPGADLTRGAETSQRKRHHAEPMPTRCSVYTVLQHKRGSTYPPPSRFPNGSAPGVTINTGAVHVSISRTTQP